LSTGTEKLAVNYVAFSTLKVQPLPLSFSQHISLEDKGIHLTINIVTHLAGTCSCMASVGWRLQCLIRQGKQ